jgi:hypothetical protein
VQILLIENDEILNADDIIKLKQMKSIKDKKDRN